MISYVAEKMSQNYVKLNVIFGQSCILKIFFSMKLEIIRYNAQEYLLTIFTLV